MTDATTPEQPRSLWNAEQRAAFREMVYDPGTTSISQALARTVSDQLDGWAEAQARPAVASEGRSVTQEGLAAALLQAAVSDDWGTDWHGDADALADAIFAALPEACHFGAWGRRCSKREGHEGDHTVDLVALAAPAEASEGLRAALEELIRFCDERGAIWSCMGAQSKAEFRAVLDKARAAL